MKYNCEDLGFLTWFECYQWLVGQGCENDELVTLTWEDSTASPQIDLDVEFVKAKAFEELYASLPTEKAVNVLTELLYDRVVDEYGGNVKPVLEFLSKILTRPE